jgi:glutamate dehydrogenase/leucine dehydrogenase
MATTQEPKEIAQASGSVIKQMSINNHEQVVFCNDNETGLKAIIAIHNTGPSTVL